MVYYLHLINIINLIIMVFTECEFSMGIIIHEVLGLGNLYGITNKNISGLGGFCIIELRFLCLQ